MRWLDRLSVLALVVFGVGVALLVIEIVAGLAGSGDVAPAFRRRRSEISAPSGLTPIDGATVEVRVADPTAAQLGLYWLARLPPGSPAWPSSATWPSCCAGPDEAGPFAPAHGPRTARARRADGRRGGWAPPWPRSASWVWP